MLASSHKTGTQNVGLFMPFTRDFLVIKLCMHQMHDFASVFYYSVCRSAPALAWLGTPDASALKMTR